MTAWRTNLHQLLWRLLVVGLIACRVHLTTAAEFERDAARVLVRRCLECHAGAEAAGGLDLTQAAGLSRGGESGAAIVAGKPDDSLLWQRVRDGEMPPPKQGKPQALPPAEVDQLRTWIADGAAWPEARKLSLFDATTDMRAGRDWWSLQPVQRPEKPAIRQTERVANPVDTFVWHRLEQRGWTMAPAVDKRSLLRRLSFDLTGLPPTFAEVEAFERDTSADAYETVVDRLLASPRYGERWGRYWLDVVRYAETCGYERDQVKPGVWKYRDWVIRAFNEDLPFERFVLEQLAGDELADRTDQSMIATGFLRLGTWNDEPNDPEEYKYERLEDMVHATSTAFLAMTVKCARCHEHKFDPIAQADYYRMAATFWAGFVEPGPREWLGGPDPKTFGTEVFAWTDRSATPPPLHLLKKGDPKHPGPVVEPSHLSFVPALQGTLAPPSAGASTSQRRLQLARWIAAPQHPLTARVWVNRLWQYHFGRGLVRSPDNFGFTGEKPTHPELLDWLASEFQSSGGRTKGLQKLLVMSHAYRQSSLHPLQEQYAQADYENRDIWRAERRRLDADALRDALLAVSGQLDLAKIGGPSFAPEISPDALEGLSMKGNAWKASPPEEQRRRSVYMFTKRSLLSPLATVFDFPDTTLPCGQRDVTTVAPQALALLNNSFLHQQSEALARRLLAETQEDALRIRHAWQRVLARAPSPFETETAAAHVQAQRTRFAAQPPTAESELRAWSSLCLVLLNTNEFIYVD